MNLDLLDLLLGYLTQLLIRFLVHRALMKLNHVKTGMTTLVLLLGKCSHS